MMRIAIAFTGERELSDLAVGNFPARSRLRNSLNAIRSSGEEKIVSRQLMLVAMVVCLLTDANATDAPPVEVKQLDYRSISKANNWTGLRLPDAISPKSVSRIILSQFEPHRILGRLEGELSDQETRDAASKFTHTLFSETGAIEKWSQLAEEGKIAELAIVTTTGAIYFVDVLQAGGSQNPIAFILRGSGFSVRIPAVGVANK
jgi:hypothetical protein